MVATTGRRARITKRFGVACVLAALAALGAASSAFAGAGDFCEWCVLKPGYGIEANAGHSSFVELESWNSDGNGFGSCIAVANYENKIIAEACSTPQGSGYNEAYCKSACKGKAGFAYVQNHSSYTSVFTGWQDWSGCCAAQNEATRSMPPYGGAMATKPDAAGAAALGVLRRARTSRDAISPGVTSTLSSASGANAALARRAFGFASGEAWVIPGTGNVCLLAEAASELNGGATCASDETAISGSLLVETTNDEAPGKVFLAGLVPDGVTEVTVTLANGGTRVLPVHENVYMREINGSPASVTIDGLGTTIPLAIPSSVAG